MRTSSRKNNGLPLFLLILAGLSLFACAQEDVAEPQVGQVQILVGSEEITAPWVLTHPDGTTTSGSGDASLVDMPTGTYAIAWGAVQGWDSPSPNPTTRILQVGATITFLGAYSVITDAMGTVIVDPSPNDLRAGWTLTGPNGFVTDGQGDVVLRGRAVGEYTVVWSAIEGYSAPANRTGTLTDDAVLQLSDTYVLREIASGTITIDASPDELNAPWSLVGSNGTTRSGSGDSTLEDLPVGNYTLNWGAVEGWNSPSENGTTQSLTADATVNFAGTYTAIEQPQGTVVIDIEPNGLGGTWLLTGPNGFVASGQSDQTLSGREVGSYLVRFGDVTGFSTPGASSGTLAADGTLTLTGRYEIAIGTIMVDPQPDSIDAPWSLSVDGQSVASGTGDATLPEMPAGTYSLLWWDVEGWTAPFPNPRTLVLEGGAQITATGVYVQQAPATGNVSIEALPGDIDAPWTLYGPDGFQTAGSGDAFFADRLVGEYRVVWDEMSGWNTPNPAEQVKNLADGATITFLGVYGSLDSPDPVAASGSFANGGSATVTGADFGTHTLDVSSGVGPNGWIDSNAAGLNLEQLSGAAGWDIGLASGATPHVSTERAHSGGKSMLTRVDFAANGGWQGVMRYEHPNGFRGIYASYWIYFDPINYAANTQWKHWRVNDNGGVSDNCSNVYQLSYWTNGQPNSYQTGPECLLDCPWPAPRECMLDVVPEPYYAPLYDDPFQYMHHNRARAESYATNAPTPRQWCRVEIWLEASDMDVSNGEFMLAITKPNQPRKLVDRWTGMLTHRSDCCRDSALPWQWFMFQNYFDDNGGGFNAERVDFFIDDIYLQFETEARVEIGEAPTYELCKQLEVQTPTSWSSGRIDFKVNHGGFAPGQDVYLFVVRDDGVAGPGLQITLQ